MTSKSDPVILINLFEVPAGVDERFVGAWERARDFLQDRDGYIDTSLHRSIAPDADFRFVNVAHWASPKAFQAATSHPDFLGAAMPFPAHPALYTVVREDAAPAGAAQGVVLINAFEVPADQDEAFLSEWEVTRDVLREQPGYLATQLHRSLSPQADFRFVNIGRYESPQAFRSAIQQPAFQAASSGIAYAAHPSLYEVIRS